MSVVVLSVRIAVILVLSTAAVPSQIRYIDTANLVPNGGFEQFSNYPLGWYYKGEHYTELVRFWSSPTGASPDAYGPDVIVPTSWKEKGFGQLKPRSGKAMSGITLYGCKDGKPHCREYLQVSLKEPLIPGQRYELSFYYTTLEHSLEIDRLGVVFVPDPIYVMDDVCLCNHNGQYLAVMPQVEPNKWTKFSFFFVGYNEAGYLIIGNFDEDQHTVAKPISDTPLNFAYYYIDDVRLRKVAPILSRDDGYTALSKRDLSAGLTIDLDNIHFDTDKTDFHPRSFEQLFELLSLMRQYPKMHIQIRGHTDDQGADTYNMLLSNRRARAVAEFLYQHGIQTERVEYIGYGKDKPVADNNTQEGRLRNRRVEFFITKME